MSDSDSMNLGKKKHKLPGLTLEKKLWKRGFTLVAGIDEVGRGCFAGPVVAGCVIFNSNIRNTKNNIPVKIDDSKKLTEKQREKSSVWIKENALSWGIGESSVALINRLGMAKATRMAFRRAVTDTNKRSKNGKIDYLLLDAFYVPFIRGLPKHKKGGLRGVKNQKEGLLQLASKSKQLAIIHGDEKSFSIAAGSIIAKVYRDKLMKRIGERKQYEKYDWIHNKGYASKRHREAILLYGITTHHRKQFIKTYLTTVSER